MLGPRTAAWITGLGIAIGSIAGCEPPPSETNEAKGSASVLSGRWRKHSPRGGDGSALTDGQREQIEKLQSIGYVAGSAPAPADRGVVLHVRDRARAGRNFYTSGHAPEAILMDMEGKVLHRWSKDFDEVWPDHPRADKPDAGFWRRAHLFPNGDVVAIHEGLGIVKLDRDSRVLWARDLPAHHDLDVLEDGRIFVLTREAHIVPRVSPSRPILEDFVLVLDPDGNETERISLLECFERSAPEHSWRNMSSAFWSTERRRRFADNPADIFHTNSLVVLDDRNADRVPAFARGNLLISMCHLDTIAVVDPRECKVLWSMNGFAMQHDPSITMDGRLVLFDNHWEPGRSSVTVLDPLTRALAWRYTGSDDRAFYSRTCGTVQSLPEGNFLVTESDNGRAFEITAERELVWEFLNPHRAGEDDEYIATLFEVTRLAPDFDVGWAYE